MIKEKLLFYNDYSSINKKCFSCQQFNHIIEECPKLHFVPNIEKIIKEYNYPHLNERAGFLRNKTRSINALSNVKKNEKGFNKFKKKLRTMKSAEEKNDSSSDSDTNLEENLEENEDEMKSLNETNSSNNNKSLKAINDPFQISYSRSLSNEEANIANEDELKTSSNELKNSSNLQKIPTKSNQKRQEYLSKQSESFTKTIRKEDAINSMTNTQNQAPTNIKNDFEIDKVYNFKNYFPDFNIENLIKRYSKLINNEKEIIRRYIKKKYANFKYYSFYTNGILSKFLNEAKIRKKNRKSLCSDPEAKKEISNSINPLARRRKSFYPLGLLNKGPIKKKTYFGKCENEEKIKSFADLINTLVQQNRKSKLENKFPNKN